MDIFRIDLVVLVLMLAAVSALGPRTIVPGHGPVLAGESSVRRLLFSNYVARPAIGAAFREASAR